MSSLFSQFCRDELEVIIQALHGLDPNKLDKSHQEYRIMCLGTAEAELHERYTQFEEKE